jgi:hypothetical protein
VIAFVTIPIVTVTASALGALPGLGNPSPGTVRQSVITWGAIGIAAVIAVAFTCARRTPIVGRAKLHRWLPAAVICVGGTIVACVLIYHGRQLGAATGGHPGGETSLGARDVKVGLLLLVFTPFLSAAATGFRRTSPRVIVLSLATTSLTFLTTFIAYAVYHLD